jgi:diacylglycerol kinase (ATP)
METILVILNPVAGRATIKRYLSEIVSALNRYNYRVLVYVTSQSKDPYKAIEMYAGSFDKVLTIGGDGTLSETIGALAKYKCDVPVCYLPSGSTNDFANSLNISSNYLDAVESIRSNNIRKLDVGKINDAYFVYVASFGLFTETSYNTPQELKNVMGNLAYALSGLSDLSSSKVYDMKLTIDDREVNGRYIFGAISNSTSIGNVVKYDDTLVDFSDGSFEILLVKELEDLAQLGETIRDILSGNYEKARYLEFYRANKVRVAGHEPIRWSIDGEFYLGQESDEISNLHQVFRLIN